MAAKQTCFTKLGFKRMQKILQIDRYFHKNPNLLIVFAT